MSVDPTDRERREANRARWDERVPIHMASEYDHTVHARWPFLERGEDGLWRMPEGMPRPPLMYALRARAEAAPTG